MKKTSIEFVLCLMGLILFVDLALRPDPEKMNKINQKIVKKSLSLIKGGFIGYATLFEMYTTQDAYTSLTNKKTLVRLKPANDEYTVEYNDVQNILTLAPPNREEDKFAFGLEVAFQLDVIIATHEFRKNNSNVASKHLETSFVVQDARTKLKKILDDYTKGDWSTLIVLESHSALVGGADERCQFKAVSSPNKLAAFFPKASKKTLEFLLEQFNYDLYVSLAAFCTSPK